MDRKEFYQSKYNYYDKFSYYVVIVSCLASITYFVSDCQLFGRFAVETLIPRTVIIFPLIVYIWFHNNFHSYKVMSVVSYLVLHLIMWNTIWAIVYLPDRTHASEGFIIMQLMFFAVGFGAPFYLSTVAHCLLIADILISNHFLHYENLDIMLSLGIPCVLGICVCHFVLERLYVEHYEMMNRLKMNSYYDALTGVYNRNMIREIVKEDEMHFVDKLGDTVGVLIFDLDFFKKVNDTFGHAKGDTVLIELTKTVQHLLRDQDYFIRWGGEEFVVLLPGMDQEQTLAFAEKMRSTVERTKTGVCWITISIGASMYDGKSYKDSIDRADKALYQAKQNGRNRVEFQPWQ